MTEEPKIEVCEGIRICPSCGKIGMKTSMKPCQNSPYEFEEIWKCFAKIGDGICGYTEPLKVKIKNERLIRK